MEFKSTALSCTVEEKSIPCYIRGKLSTSGNKCNETIYAIVTNRSRSYWGNYCSHKIIQMRCCRSGYKNKSAANIHKRVSTGRWHATSDPRVSTPDVITNAAASLEFTSRRKACSLRNDCFSSPMCSSAVSHIAS